MHYLREIADIQTGPFGSQLHASDYVEHGIPSIMPQDIINNRINDTSIARIKAEDAERLKKYLVQKGDIVYSRRGDVERHALVSDLEAGWLCGTGCLRVRVDAEQADPEFIHYYLSMEESCAWIRHNAHGTTMPNLNTTILGECPINLPDVTTQRQIASILSAIDRKIIVNERINDNLAA